MIDDILALSGWIDAAGIMLMVLGMVMIVMEIFLPTLGLFGLAGIAAITVATIVLSQSGFLQHMNISIGSIIGIVSTLVILALLSGWITWRAYQKKVSTGPESFLGANAEVISWTGREGRVRVQGEIWQAGSDHPYDFQPGDSVLIARVDDLHLRILPHQT
jgi:membrane-bound serine protease (ClpP class)